MKAIVTVLGKDKVGIIADVATIMKEYGVNICDISQTLMQDYFTMIMLVDLSAATVEFAALQKELAARGRRVLLVELDSGLRSVDYIAGVYGKTVYDVEDVLNGRCEAGKAVVESPVYRNLYVISAPYSGGHILPAALRVFVEKVGPVFDTIVLDTAAGMGVPFEAAMGVAHRALLVLTPDPVSIRDGRIVCDALEAGGCPEIRLIINKVPRTLANCGIQSLDECIDTVGAQLIGVVPFSTEIQKAGATGAPLAPAGRPRLALRAIAARLCGQYTPLVIR